MKDYFAEWYEIANLNPTPDTLARRWQGVEQAAGAIDSSGINQLGACYHSLKIDGAGPASLIDALREADNTFVAANRAQELAVLSAAVLNETLADGDYANADLAALVVVVPGGEGLRSASVIPQLVDIAEQYLVDRSSSLRSVSLARSGDSTVSKELSEAVVKALAENNAAAASEPLNRIIAAQNQIVADQRQSIEVLTEAYNLLREESDMLWWLTGMHSRITEAEFASLPPGTAAIVMGRELADLTRVVPGPLAMQAIAKRMLTQCFDEDGAKAVQISSAVNGVPREIRAVWAKQFAGRAELPMCPIANAVVHSAVVEKDSQWPALFKASQGFDAKSKLQPELLCRQVYLENLLIRG